MIIIIIIGAILKFFGQRFRGLQKNIISHFLPLDVLLMRGDIGTETHVGTLPAKINCQCMSKLVANLFCHQSTLLRVGWYHPLPLTHVLQVL